MINLRKFARELAAAGLSNAPLSWTDTSIVFDSNATREQRDAALAVLAAHDPAPDPNQVRSEDRAEALAALIGNATAETALDGFFRSIKARPDLPNVVKAYIAKHGI